MLRTLPLVAAVPLLVAAGLIEGRWTNRWAGTAELEAAAARLDDVPLTVGDWKGEAQVLEESQVARAGVRGYLLRRYVHGGTGRAVTVFLVCGRPGPVAVHTPDVCYRSTGYALAAPPTRAALAGSGRDPAPEFWSARLRKPGPTAEQLCIRWAWAAAGVWGAPDNPRLTFAGSSHLYKLYVIHEGGDDTDGDPAEDFLRDFLPRAGAALFPDA